MTPTAQPATRTADSGAISPTDTYAALMEMGLAVGQTEKSAAAAINAASPTKESTRDQPAHTQTDPTR